MVEVAAVTALLTAAKSGVDALSDTTDLVEKLRDAGDENATAVANELMEALQRANQKALELQSQLLDLKSAAEEEESFQEKRARYEVVVCENHATFLSLKEGQDPAEHYKRACPNCAEERQRIVPLQPAGILLKCDACRSAIRFRKAAPVPHGIEQ